MADRTYWMAHEVMQQMLQDVHAVSTIPLEVVQQLAEVLEHQAGFLRDDRLAELIAQFVEDEAQGSAVFTTLQNLTADSVPQVLATVQRWREASERNRERFTDEAFAALQENLPSLIRDYPALTRMKKADQLRDILGNELQGVMFICDARPVYNSTRDTIEGLIPVTTMKLVYERQNMDTEEFELALTGEQLAELIFTANQAKEKLAVLRSSITRWIPDGCVDEGNEDADEA